MVIKSKELINMEKSCLAEFRILRSLQSDRRMIYLPVLIYFFFLQWFPICISIIFNDDPNKVERCKESHADSQSGLAFIAGEEIFMVPDDILTLHSTADGLHTVGQILS